MNTSIGKSGLSDYLANQINTFFPDGQHGAKQEISKCIDLVLERISFCFSRINSKYYNDEGKVVFNHLNADHYAMFLYFASNILYKKGENINLCNKIFLLNKCLHGIDAFYEVELPDIFLFVHPIGTVLGRAKYSDYFMVYQRCNIGSNNGIYPTLHKYVTLHPGSSVLGNCEVKNNCRIAAGALLMDRNLEDNSLYIGNPRDFVIKEVKNKTLIWI